MPFQSHEVVHGPHLDRGRFDTAPLASRSASTPRAPPEAPANPHQTQSRVAPDIALRAKRSPSHDENRLRSDLPCPTVPRRDSVIHLV